MTIRCSEVIPTSRPPVAVIVAMALSLSLIFWFDFLLGTASRMLAKRPPQVRVWRAQRARLCASGLTSKV